MLKIFSNLNRFRNYNYISLSYSLFGGHIVSYDSKEEGFGNFTIEDVSILSKYRVNELINKEDRVFSYIIGYEEGCFTILNLLEISSIEGEGDNTIVVKFNNGSEKSLQVRSLDYLEILNDLSLCVKTCNSLLKNILKVRLDSTNSSFECKFEKFLLYIEEKIGDYSKYTYFYKDSQDIIKKYQSEGVNSFLTLVDTESDGILEIEAEKSPLTGIIGYEGKKVVFNSHILELIMAEKGYYLQGKDISFHLGKCGEVQGRVYGIGNEYLNSIVSLRYIEKDFIKENIKYLDIRKELGGF